MSTYVWHFVPSASMQNIYIYIYNEKLPNQQMTEQYFHTSFLAQHLLSWQAKNEVAANKSWAKWLSNMPRIPDTC